MCLSRWRFRQDPLHNAPPEKIQSNMGKSPLSSLNSSKLASHLLFCAALSCPKPMSFLSLDRHGNCQTLTVNPPANGVSLKGHIRIPGDKSISHRALMLGAIAEGETVIEGLLLGEDPRSTAACFRAMGAEISELNSEKVIVKGRGLGQLQEPTTVLDAGNSGTTMRLMLGLLAGQPDCFFTVTGDDSLRHRPMSRVIQPLQQMGAQIWGRSNNKFAPISVQGRRLNPTHYQSPIASAQVKSCLLLAGLTTEGETTVT